MKDWDIKINRGILTGLNEAFIISKEKRDELVEADPKSAEIIRPILRGRDIKRYSIDFQDKYLIALFPAKNYKIDDYPAIKDWLINGEWVTVKTKGNPPTPIGTGQLRLEQTGARHEVNGIKFKSRKKTSNKWFETQDSIGYWDDFSKPKILFSEMVQSPQFYLDETQFIVNDTVTFISGSQLEYLVKFLNSRIIFSIYKSFYAGGGLGSNGIRVKKTFLQNLPIPKNQINSLNDEDIEKEIQEILELSSHEVRHLSEI